MIPSRATGAWRRRRALPPKQRGWAQLPTAEAFGVSEVTVGRRLARARRGGSSARAARPAPGRPPRLTRAGQRPALDSLGHGPEAYASRGDVRTCARVAAA